MVEGTSWKGSWLHINSGRLGWEYMKFRPDVRSKPGTDYWTRLEPRSAHFMLLIWGPGFLDHTSVNGEISAEIPSSARCSSTVPLEPLTGKPWVGSYLDVKRPELHHQLLFRSRSRKGSKKHWPQSWCEKNIAWSSLISTAHHSKIYIFHVQFCKFRCIWNGDDTPCANGAQ